MTRLRSRMRCGFSRGWTLEGEKRKPTIPTPAKKRLKKKVPAKKVWCPFTTKEKKKKKKKKKVERDREGQNRHENEKKKSEIDAGERGALFRNHAKEEESTATSPGRVDSPKDPRKRGRVPPAAHSPEVEAQRYNPPSEKKWN